jgi:hypothetical protein
MALTVNRTLSDGGTTASFEQVSDGGSEDNTIVDTSGLSGTFGTGPHLVRVVRVLALVCENGVAGGSVSLYWHNPPADVEFLTLPIGTTDLRTTFTPTVLNQTGDIIIKSTGGNISYTIQLVVEKTTGFPNSNTHW